MENERPRPASAGAALDVCIVIVNWNTADLLRLCLERVLESTGVTFDVCVVDNASEDGSADRVAASFPQVKLIRHAGNYGFSRGTNAGLRLFGFGSEKEAARYALLLNPDTELPPAALHDMVAFLDAHPEAGAAGPRLIKPDGSLDPACRRGFPTPASAFYRFSGVAALFPKSSRFGRYNMTYCDPAKTTEVDCVNGAFMMVRARAISKVGLLDEEFFFGGEDLDWAFRIKGAGWKIFYHPAVAVQHVKRAAFRKNRAVGYEFQRAMWLFYRKHYRESTPAWLHLFICTALVLRGGPRLLGEMHRNRTS